MEEHAQEPHDQPGLFKRPIWFRNEHLTWLDQQVAELRAQERSEGGEITQISRSEVLRRLIDKAMA